ncbi:hypothetical protein JCM10449v2_001276 [Rhodotorula kratochvilovae]
MQHAAPLDPPAQPQHEPLSAPEGEIEGAHVEEAAPAAAAAREAGGNVDEAGEKNAKDTMEAQQGHQGEEGAREGAEESRAGEGDSAREGAKDDAARVEAPTGTSVGEDAGAQDARTDGEARSGETTTGREEGAAGAAAGAGEAGGAEGTADAGGVPLQQPTPSNPARETSSLLAPPPPPSSSLPTLAVEGASPAATPPSVAGADAPSSAAGTPPPPTASPALSASSGPASGAERPLPPKKFQSSLSVNKKFLEKAGEKGKPEVKPVTARLATPPVPTPVSTSHPRLLAGKLSSGPSISLSTSASSAASSPGSGWGAKKPATPTPASAVPGTAGSTAAAGAAAGKPVWGAPAPAPTAAPAPAQPQTQAYAPGAMGRGMGGMGARGGEPQGWGLGARRMEMDFPTAAEAASAKDVRQKVVAVQSEARDRASQARAAATAAHNAHLLEELDAFRGVHLDPNAAHWDEADDDDFLDTTIEFADGTQYKLDTAPPTPAAEEELREPGPRELALRERPLAPGEVVVPPRREERFRDDYDRSWPRRPSGHGGEGRTLFNERLGKLEPAAAGAGAAHPPARAHEPTSILRPRAGSNAHWDLPPHLALSGGAPPPAGGRRPSITSPRLGSHAQLHRVDGGSGRRESFHEPAAAAAARPAAWGGMGARRPSMSASGAAVGAPDRQLPPHLAGRAGPPAPAAQLAPTSPPRARRPSVPAAQAVLPTSPTRAAPAPAPADSVAAPAAAAPVAAPAEPAVPKPSIEELHAREMHAAAERAKKRREEEEQKRLEQIERAKRKALELEERMRAQEEAKAKERREKAEAAAAAAAAAKPKVQERRPSVAAPPPAATAPADKATSWRAAAKPLAPVPAPAPTPAAVPAPAKVQLREQLAAQPTAILPRPPASTAPPAAQPPTQPAAWRRPSAAAAPQAVPAARAPLRQLPPHLAAQAAQAEAKAAAAAAAAPPAPPAQPAPAAPIAAPAEPAKPSTPPAPPAATLASPPSSPAHDRKAQPSQQQAAAAAKLGYKLPAVSQFDDLMSRIKGVMAQPAEPATSPKDAPAEPATAPKEAPAAEPVVEVPTVKLPPRGAASKPARASAAPAPAAPVVALPAPTEARGRGRGRSETARAARQAPAPAFESREPVLPYHSSRIAREPSPPPAWRQFSILLASCPPRRPVNARMLKNFHQPNFPRPLYPFSWEPVLKDVNPRRLSRDEMLLPKKYDKNGVPVYAVVLPKRRFGPRVAQQQDVAKREITVSISNVALVRQAAPEPSPAVAVSAGEVADGGFAPFGKGRGRGRMPESSSWRRADASGVPTASLDAVQDAAEASEEVLAGEQAPLSRAQDGFYRALEAQTKGEAAKFTGELNGEKVEATPRKETTAPGRDANGLGKPPSSPPYKPQDLSQATASPSAAAPWASKALTYSALDPTASSVWSAAPEEGSVHARAIAASNLPENSLQGIVDEDPSEALPSSLAELKSEDGHSVADSKELAKPAALAKDEAKLRAAAPSFSSFLHESAGAVNPAAAAAVGGHPRLVQHPYTGFPAQIPPQSTPSPISAYSPAPQFSPHLYAQMPQFARPLQQQQPPPLYPSFPGQSASPFATQPIHQAYSTSPFAPTSPIPPTLGYPSPYRESPSPAVPHGITNPALIASYNFGHQTMAGSGGPRGYGAVGAAGGPPGPGPIGRPPHQQGAPGSGMYAQRAPAPSSYFGGSGAGVPPQQGPYGSPFQQQGPPPQSPYRVDGFSHGGDGRPPSQHGPGAAYGPAGSAGTMPSPVIMPQQLPPVPLFGAGPGHPHGHHHHPLASPVASAQGMGMGGYGPGGYGPNGGYPRGGGAPIGRGPPGGGGALGAVGGRW